MDRADEDGRAEGDVYGEGPGRLSCVSHAAGPGILMADRPAPPAGPGLHGQHRRLHGHESIAEKNLLLALDFAGDVTDVVSQPMKIKFFASGSPAAHSPTSW